MVEVCTIPPLEVYAKDTGCAGSPFTVHSEVQVTGSIDNGMIDVLQKHRSKDTRTNANRLPDPESILEIRRVLEGGHLEVRLWNLLI